MVIKSGLSMCFAALSHGLKSTRSSSPSGRRGATAHLRPIPPRRRPATQAPSAPALSCRGRRRPAPRTFHEPLNGNIAICWRTLGMGGPSLKCSQRKAANQRLAMLGCLRWSLRGRGCEMLSGLGGSAARACESRGSIAECRACCACHRRKRGGAPCSLPYRRSLARVFSACA